MPANTLPSPSHPTLHRPLRRTLAAVAAAGVLALTACGSGGGSAGTGETAVGAPAPAQDSRGSFAGGATGGADQGASKEGATGAPGRATGADVVAAATRQLLARSAGLTLAVKDVTAAATQVRAAAIAAGGMVTDEKLSSVDSPEPVGGGVWGSITLAVPSAKLDPTLDALGRIGRVTNRTVASEDVTSQVVDTESRVATMRESVARVRALMTQATRLSDIVALESELASRQADLESLESQLASLKDRVALSPVTVTLTSTSAPAPTPGDDETGFLAGLEAGWRALMAATAVVLTILGGALPFAVVLALLFLPARWAWRRLRPAHPAAPVAPAPPSPTQP